MASKTATLDLRITRTFDAPRALVWQAWTRPEHLMKWLCPKDFTVIFAEGELRPGGTWRSGMRSPRGQDHVAGGVYREVEPEHRLVFTHLWEGGEGPETTVTVTLEERQGKTEMAFEQVGFATAASRDGHQEGWSESFDNLAQHLVEDRLIVITRVFDAPRELVWKAWHEPEHVERWWGPKGFTTRVEELDLRPGGRSKFVMVGPDGTEYPVTGVYSEVVVPEKTVGSDEFDEGFPGDPAELPQGVVLTCYFDEAGRGTRLTMWILHPTAESRRNHEEMGVVGGWGSSFDCLDEHLAEHQGRLTLTRVSDCEVKLVRVFDAPRALVWEAVTKPEHIRRWWGCRDHEMIVCEMDFRVGGRWRYVQRTPDGHEHPFTGVYKEIVEGEKTVSTFIYDVENIRDHASLETVTLEERDGKTVLTNLVRHDSPESLEGHLSTGMERGATESMNRLEELLSRLRTPDARE